MYKQVVSTRTIAHQSHHLTEWGSNLPPPLYNNYIEWHVPSTYLHQGTNPPPPLNNIY